MRFALPTPLWERFLFALVFFVPGFIFASIAIVISLVPKNGDDAKLAIRGLFLFGVLTILCFVQGTREMIGRAKRSSQVPAGDSDDELPEDELLQTIPCPLPLVPQEEAEALVRATSEKHAAKGILRSLGNLPQKKLDNAAVHFARQMEDDETPLALMDASFLQNGKAGFLLTNRGLYSSFCSHPIWLADIDTVSFAEPGFADHLAVHFLGGLYGIFIGFRQLQNRLKVNGKTVYSTGNRFLSAFWIELLTELAEAARQTQVVEDDSTSKPSVIVLESALRMGESEVIQMRPIRNPSWHDLERGIRALDQNIHPSLRIWAGEIEQAPALDILGGNGKYVLRELGDGWVFYDPSAGEEEVEVCTGPPVHRAPGYYVCTDLSRVLEIARHYLETGTLE